jgi:hypothetical protein
MKLHTAFGFAGAMAVALACAADAQARGPSKKQQEYEATLARWIGRSVDELMVAYGSPTSSNDLPSGSTLMSFTGLHSVGPSDMGTKLFGKKGAILDSDTTSEYKCVVNFAVGKDGLVKAARIQLNEGLWILDPCGKIIKGP